MRLNKDEILNRTDRGLRIFHKFLNISFTIGRNFNNPLYDDKRASCNIYLDRRNNIYRMKDFGNVEYSGDCFEIVGKIHNLSCKNPIEFLQILETINKEMGLLLHSELPLYPIKKETHSYKENNTSPVSQTKTVKVFTVKEKDFSEKDFSFWAQSEITKEVLKRYNTVVIKEYRSLNKDGEMFTLNYTNEEPIYGYRHNKSIKLYRPFSKLRFLYGGELPGNYCFGLEQLPLKGGILFITGGEKDVMTLSTHGFNAICFGSETTNIPKELIHKMSFRFKHIVILYDCDKTGKESAVKHIQELSEYGIKNIVLPLTGSKQEKDITDYFRIGNTKKDFIQLFIDLLDNVYSNTMSILKSCEINLKNPPPMAQTIISVNDVPLATQGNLLCITGGEGTGKSNYIAAIIAGTIQLQTISVDTLGLTVEKNKEGKAVLFYDTEQSEVQLYKNINNLVKRSKLRDKPDCFHAFCLTGMSRKERLQCIVESMDRYYYQYSGIQMIVIDGIADLIKCANDEVESIAIIEELYRLAGIYNTCIIVVLHFVPNGLKLRGHLGSELQRKAACILSIEKDEEPEVSVVKALKVREGSPLDVPLIQFGWDKQAGMHTYIGEKSKEIKEKRKEVELRGVAKEIFFQNPFLSFTDLCEQIQSLLDVRERTAKSYIKFMRDKEMIKKDSSGTNYILSNH